jgi:hypothetical protein
MQIRATMHAFVSWKPSHLLPRLPQPGEKTKNSSPSANLKHALRSFPAARLTQRLPVIRVEKHTSTCLSRVVAHEHNLRPELRGNRCRRPSLSLRARAPSGPAVVPKRGIICTTSYLSTKSCSPEDDKLEAEAARNHPVCPDEVRIAFSCHSDARARKVGLGLSKAPPDGHDVH